MAQYRTLREIANRMGWKSSSTVLRRHKLDDFPMYPDFGTHGLIWVTSDELIHVWESRKVALNQGARLKQPWKWRHKEGYTPYNWKLRIDTEKVKFPKPEREAQSLRETKEVEPASQTSQKSFSARVAERWFEKRKRAGG